MNKSLPEFGRLLYKKFNCLALITLVPVATAGVVF
jgi:hypothetical protein